MWITNKSFITDVPARGSGGGGGGGVRACLYERTAASQFTLLISPIRNQ